MRRSLTRSERLRTKAEFAHVFKQPDFRSGCHGAKLVARRNGTNENRFAVALVRKFGNAVERNYARRILKEIYRNAKQDLPRGYDMIIVLFPGDFGYHERKRQFSTLMQRAGFANAAD